jgi:hypothetical protein
MRQRIYGTVMALALAGAALVAGAPPATAAASGLQLGKVYYDPPGSDTTANSQLDAEWIVVKNVTSTTKCLTGWTVRDAANHVYTFGSFCLGAYRPVYLHTGKGTNTSGNRYWNQGWYIWNNTGDTAYLRNGSGTLMDSCHYAGGAPGYFAC